MKLITLHTAPHTRESYELYEKSRKPASLFDKLLFQPWDKIEWGYRHKKEMVESVPCQVLSTSIAIMWHCEKYVENGPSVLDTGEIRHEVYAQPHTVIKRIDGHRLHVLETQEEIIALVNGSEEVQK